MVDRSERSSRQNWLLGLSLVVLVLLAYVRVWQAGFIWDDDLHLTRNPSIVGTLGFKSIWLTSAATYYPLTLTTFWIEHALWGLAPMPYHLVNVLQHAASGVLLWLVLKRLGVRGAWLGAALWTLHPVQVESVAWITEMKNTQSCLFYLLSILFFVEWLQRPHKTSPMSVRYAVALICAVLAILSKSSTVMLPLALMLCTWWLNRRLTVRDIVALAPFFLISAAASAWTIWEQKFHSGASGGEWTLSWGQRAIVAGLDIWFYIGKLLWPHPLVFQYPRWEIDAGRTSLYLPLVAAIALFVILWLRRNASAGAAFFAYSYFIALLFPVLGFFDVYYFRYSFVGDHFQYLASIGPLAAAGAGLTTVFGLFKAEKSISRLAGCGLILLLGFLTWRQTRIYRDPESLWQATIAHNERSWFAHTNLGAHFLESGRIEDASSHLQTAVELNPGVVETHNGVAAAYLRANRSADAAEHSREALKIDPKNAEAHGNLGTAYLQMNRVSEAIEHLQTSVQIDPGYVEAFSNLGFALARTGRLEEAVRNVEQAVKLDPNYSPAHYNFANVLLQTGREREALEQFQGVLNIDPNDAEAQNAIAWIMATSPDAALRDAARATELARRANESTGNHNPAMMATLAAALAEAGNFSEAQAVAETALRLADQIGNHELAGDILEQLERYRANQPHRENRRTNPVR